MGSRNVKGAATKTTKSVKANGNSQSKAKSADKSSHNHEAVWPQEYLGRRERHTLDGVNTKPLMKGKTSYAQEFQTLDIWNDLKFWERQTLETRNAKPRTQGMTPEVRNAKTWNVKPQKQARNAKPRMPGTQPRVLEKLNIGG